MDVAAASRLLGVLAVAAGVLAVACVAGRRHAALAAVRAHALGLGAAVAGVATAGSLYYSEVAGFVPCGLCWYQRIAMYPLAGLLAVAAVRGDDAIRPYARLLAGAGLATSAWHLAVQHAVVPAGATCTIGGSCAARWVEVFGVLTIPAMAALGFAAVLALLSLPATTRPGGPGRPD